MADTEHTTRRSLLKGIPAGLIAALSAGNAAEAAGILLADAVPEQTDFARVMHHARELHRALNETCPGQSASEYFCELRSDGYFVAAGVGGCNFLETAGGWP